MSIAQTAADVDDREQARQQALALSQQRSDIDEELTSNFAVLRQQNVTLDSSLIDAQGFPLAGTDLIAVRTARKRIAELRNDRKDIEDRLHDLLQKALERRPGDLTSAVAANGTATEPRSSENSAQTSSSNRVFARVNTVAPRSPAAEAGLEAGDLIISFDSIDAGNNDNLRALPRVVREGISVSVFVRRGETQIVSLTLTPRSDWGGRGMLGCHLLPA